MLAANAGTNPGLPAIFLLSMGAVALISGLYLARPFTPGGEIVASLVNMPLDHRIARVIVAALGVLACMAATLMVLHGSDRTLASTIWLLGWLPIVASATPWHMPVWTRTSDTLRRHFPEICLLLVILAVALAYRLPGLDTLPGNIHNDEAAVGLQARQDVSPGAQPLLSIGWAELPQLGFVYAGLFLRAFGDNLWALRFSSLVAEVSVDYFCNLLARDLFGRRVAILAAAFSDRQSFINTCIGVVWEDTTSIPS